MNGRRYALVTLLATVMVQVALLGVAAAQSAAQNPAYRIGPEDVLAISVWDNKEVDHVVFVRPDGKISLPLLGEVQAAGLTVVQLIDELNKQFGRTIKGAQATVLVKEIRSRAVYFVGGVGKPGPLQLMQDLTLLQAVSLAGGLSPAADQEGSYVLRGGKAIPINFVRLLRGDTSQNVPLQPGDTVVIPIADQVYVQGEVKKPGAIKLTKDLTVVRAITEAGGFTDLAAPKRVTVLRGQGGKKENLRVNVDAMISDPKDTPDINLHANDIVIVPQRLF
jgi:polysaccharide biosynthesis/export protein